MQKFQVHQTDVCTSSLTQRSYRAAPCELLVDVRAENLHSALQAFHEFPHDFSGLRISGLADLSFLAEVPSLRYLEVVNQKKLNTRYLDGLSNLRGLCVESPGAGIDFSCFPELEVFHGDWHPDNIHLRQCGELRTLQIWQFKPKTVGITELACITRLERLKVVQTTIGSLEGLETLEDLRYLEIAYASKLESLAAIAVDGIGLREVGIEKAKKIASYRPLAALPYLRRLRLFGCATMSDLKWTQGMNRLDSFSFVETLVENGDLSPLLELPSLQYVGTMDKKHYNYKFATMNELLSQRRLAAGDQHQVSA